MSTPRVVFCEKCGKVWTYLEGITEACPRCNDKTTFWVGKKFHFDAAHFIPEHPKCGEVHGHTWKVYVEVEGELGDNSMVLDLHILSKVVEEIFSKLDHKLLNDILPFTPTCERMADYLVSRIYVHLGAEGVHLPKTIRVKVQEGEGGYAIAQE